MRKWPILWGIVLVLVWLYFTKIDPAANPKRRDRGASTARLDRSRWPLVYTRHARCRMDCRGISQAEVEEIFQKGTVNFQKSDLQDRPCPTFAVEGVTRTDRQRVRLVFAQCEGSTKVVTCIDLDREYTCTCN